MGENNKTGSSGGERENGGFSKLKCFIVAGRKSLKDQWWEMKLKQNGMMKNFCIEEFGLDTEDWE